MVRVSIRSGTARDAPFLRRMLYEAACWREEPSRRSEGSVLGSEELEPYVEELGTERDTIVIAEEEGEPVGAAWYRVFEPDRPGYGWVDPTFPELSMAVLPGRRGRGIGRVLLRALLARARDDGVPALSLSVDEENPARNLYRSEGFVDVELVGGSWTMLSELAAS